MAAKRFPGVYQRGRNWYYVVSYRDSQGRRKQLWRVGGKTAAEADRARTAAKAQRDHGMDISPERLTLEAFGKRWLASKKPTVSANTYDSYVHALRRLNTYVGGVKLAMLKPFHVQQATEALSQAGSAPSTIAQSLSIYRRHLDDAVEWELLTRNVAHRVKAPRQAKRVLVLPPTRSIRRLFEVADSTTLRIGYQVNTQYCIGPLVRLAVYTGMRVSELLALEWRDVDLEDGTVRVNASKTDAGRRTISIGPDAVEMLRGLRSGGGVVSISGNVLMLTRNQTKTAWLKVRQAAGLQGLHFHDLRHIHVSLLIEQGIDFKIISSRVGHTSIKTTMDLYGHLRPKSDAPAALALEAALANS